MKRQMTAMIKDERGIATSLLEATLVLIIGAIISTVALGAALNHMDDAKLARAQADTEMIGIAIHSFTNDTGFAPAYKRGNLRGPQDDVFFVLQSDGSDPIVDASLHWPMTNADDRDLLTNQLISNQPGYSGTGNFLGIAYPRMGQITWSRFKGWNGPYLGTTPKPDPWGDRYFVNVQLLTQQGLDAAHDTLTLGVGQRPAVFVISAGPNQRIDTRFDQTADGFTAAGDDIIFRIQ